MCWNTVFSNLIADSGSVLACRQWAPCCVEIIDPKGHKLQWNSQRGCRAVLTRMGWQRLAPSVPTQQSNDTCQPEPAPGQWAVHLYTKPLNFYSSQTKNWAHAPYPVAASQIQFDLVLSGIGQVLPLAVGTVLCFGFSLSTVSITNYVLVIVE